jgi:hypothetical protein
MREDFAAEQTLKAVPVGALSLLAMIVLAFLAMLASAVFAFAVQLPL